MSDERDDAHGRLGRLFAALVNNEDDVDRPDAPEEAAVAGEAETSSLDVEALSRSLMGSPDPMGVLRGLVADVRARSEEGPGEKGAGSPPVPSPFELYLAMRLTEAGLLEDDVSLPMTSVVRPRTSDLFYLRVIDESLPWLAKLKILRIEAALNCALLVGRAIDDPNASTLEEIVRCEQRIERSIVSQAARCAERVDGPARGEWAVRRSISHAVECLQLPHRLTARFRTNVVGGRVAIEIDLVPPRAWPSSAYVEGLGIVPATTEMRRRAASDYNLRLGVLLAAYVFGVAPQVREVWVAGVVDGATGHHCYYSARLDRWALERLDLEGLVDPWAVMRDAGATIDESDRTADPRARFKKHAHVAPANRAKLVYTVREGDVIGGIAMKFGVRLNDLKYWNGKTRNLIRVGEKLVVYVPKDKVDYYKSKADTRYAGPASNNDAEVEPLNEGEYFYYTVKQGDNLWSIAKKFEGISNRDIMRWNGLSEKAVRKLKPGQKLKIKI